jgi:hypothetical protein
MFLVGPHGARDVVDAGRTSQAFEQSNSVVDSPSVNFAPVLLKSRYE